MRIFVSYSRRDAGISRRIADRLETAGHTVWIDTDDIVGSERWRKSVAEAIMSADVVLLVVSPAAMQSKSVEREITVAAEHDLRILPVVVEMADVSVGLLYDLAGVQRISFVDRRFDDAIRDLEAALALSMTARHRSGGVHPPASSPLTTRKHPPTRTVLVWLGALGAAFVVMVLMRNLNDDSSVATGDVAPTNVSDVPAADDGAASASGGAADRSGVTEIELGTTVWFAGWTIEAEAVRFDSEAGSVTVDILFTNDQHGSDQPCALFESAAALVVDSQRFRLWDSCDWLPPATSNRKELRAEVDDDFELAHAAIEFGSPEQHQAIVPLDGGPATSEFPTSAPLAGSLDTDVSSFAAERVEVVPAACWGSSRHLTFKPARKQEESVVVSGSATNNHRFPIGFGKARLTLPDGTNLASDSLSGTIYALDPGQTVHEVRACFTVPAPVSGEYRFSITTDISESFPEPLTLTF